MTAEQLHAGWYFLALTRELDGEISPLTLGERALMAVREDDERIQVFDARCPHRGAHLGYGGTRAGVCVVCPFHGKRIALGGSARLSVREHRVLRAGEALFIRLADSPPDDRGFEQAMRDLAERRPLVGAVTRRVSVPTDIVVENAFDVDHFTAVHGVPQITGMEIKPGICGELVIEGEFRTKPPGWTRSTELRSGSRFFARAFSPSVVVTEIGAADASHTVVTGGTPTGAGAIARVAVAVPDDQPGALEPLIVGARRAIEQDVVVWDHLDLSMTPKLDARDRQVLAFRQFCAGFTPVAG
jgi:3-ketosteroid 9alpha-monooxygenase subunit A